MKKILFFIQLFFFVGVAAQCQEQRALIIGIDQYEPPADYVPSTNIGRLNFPNLEGCKNDGLTIYSLINSKFNFPSNNIDTLFNSSATRSGILNAMNALLNKCKQGDIAFIYYAGHGSEVANSYSFELNKLDQTIVPCDTWKEGIRDIRDKELSKIFNAFLDKKIKLTVIFDCCHSGSISRGPNTIPGKVRFMPAANWDAKDSSKSEIPETRIGDNFLIFSAAQSNEPAAERIDDDGISHGAFTLALSEAINQQSVDASALNIFISARAILKSYGNKQEPVIGGVASRQGETLFGIKKGTLPDCSLIPVSGVFGRKVQLQGGLALNLSKENELAYISSSKDTLFKLKIDSVLGINKSWASVTQGDIKEIKPGTLFKVINWVSSKKPLLKIYIPPVGVSESAVLQFNNVVKDLKKSTKIKWMESIGKDIPDPFTSVFWIADKCFIKEDTGAAILLSNISAEHILKYCKKDSSLYVEMPVSQKNADQFYKRLSLNKNLKIVDVYNNANYVLFGRLGSKGYPAYGFRKTQIVSQDSLEALPMVTDCFELSETTVQSKNISDSLYDRAIKLSKLKGWIDLIATSNSAQQKFSYNLELFNEDNNLPILNGKYHIGNTISLRLEVNEKMLNSINSKAYVYVFAIDQSGAMQLLYPEDGNTSNQYPQFENGNVIKEIKLLSGAVPPPSGTDTYFLLASEDPIENANLIFNQDNIYSGIRTRGLSNSNPLQDLLDMGNEGSRGCCMPVHFNWSLQKLSFYCTY